MALRSNLALMAVVLVCCGAPGGQDPAVVPTPGASTGETPSSDARQVPAPMPAPTPEPGPAPAPVVVPGPTDASTPGPVSSSLPPAYQEILDAHNLHRARHCAQPLRWSEKLHAVAQDWADQLAGANCAFEHRQRNRFGENLAFFAPVGSQSPAGVATGWYSEVEQYDFSKGTFGFDTGHFTQVVWTSTTELGCGVSRCNGGEIWVCNYDPPGNMMGEFARRVLHPSQCVSNAR